MLNPVRERSPIHHHRHTHYPLAPPSHPPLPQLSHSTQRTRPNTCIRTYVFTARGVLSGFVGVGVEVQRDPRLRGPCGRAGLRLGLVLQGGEGQRQGHHLLRPRGVEPHGGPGAVSLPRKTRESACVHSCCYVRMYMKSCVRWTGRGGGV